MVTPSGDVGSFGSQHVAAWHDCRDSSGILLTTYNVLYDQSDGPGLRSPADHLRHGTSICVSGGNFSVSVLSYDQVEEGPPDTEGWMPGEASSTSAARPRRLRADARRNRERLLTAA